VLRHIDYPRTLTGTTFLVLLVLLVIPTNAQAQPLTAIANGESHLLIVETGTSVIFEGNLSGLNMDNVTEYGWHFNRSHLSRINESVIYHDLFAEGVYNATFYVRFDNGSRSEKLVLVIVHFEQEDEPRPVWYWFFTMLGLGEILTGSYLFWATWRFKQNRIYLHKAKIYLELTGKK